MTKFIQLWSSFEFRWSIYVNEKFLILTIIFLILLKRIDYLAQILPLNITSSRLFLHKTVDKPSKTVDNLYEMWITFRNFLIKYRTPLDKF